MLKLQEELLQFIWRHRLLKPEPLITSSGKKIVVLKPGELNRDAGPDFFNAQIRVDELLLVGNIELHVRTSDWLRHKHQQDKSYDKLILHVVYEHDLELHQNTSNQVEILELKPFIYEQTLETYAGLYNSKTKLPCAAQLKHVNDLKLIGWMERMTVERLEEKVKRIEGYFNNYGGDYTQTFYTCLLRSFGFKVNAIPFELLAKQLPVTLLLKHSDHLLQLEALLLGMSGLLQNQFEDKYIRDLQNEFEYLKSKYLLRPLSMEVFKFSKMRPANFPDLRLMQFASLLHHGSELFVSPQRFLEYKELMSMLEIRPGDYWKHHYSRDGKMQEKDLNFGRGSAEHLIINTFAPFFFFYAKKLAKPEYSDAAINLLGLCNMESNAKTRLFESRKAILKNAAASQAMIHLYDNYCSSKECLKCGIASAILNPV